MEYNTDHFLSMLEKMNISLSDKQLQQFMTYYEMLIEKNKVMNLTAITDFDEVVEKHFVDSVSLIQVVDLHQPLNVIDLGTGAGFFFVFPIWKRICNPGNLAGILVCLFLLFVTIFPRKFAHIVQRCWEPLGGKIGLSAVGILLAAGLTFSAVMSVQMVRTICTKPTAPETVVVLGCKVRGTRPSRMLIRRLEAAQAYLEENPDVLCITTGGQGAGEDVPEGQAMRDWLIGHGIAAERIIAEDTSKDTQENLEHAAAILQEQGLGEQVVIITDGFHQYRASLLAKRAGLQSESVCAKTNPLYVPTYWVREWMALFQLLVLGHG